MPTSLPVKFERAVATDIRHLVELKLAMFAESGRAHLLPVEKRDAVVADYRALYEQDLAAHFIARHQETIVACAGAFLKSDLPYKYFTPSVYGFIGDVYTAPIARRGGLARSLSRSAIDWLRSRGVRSVRLLASEEARPIYASLGFKPTDEMVLHLP